MNQADFHRRSFYMTSEIKWFVSVYEIQPGQWWNKYELKKKDQEGKESFKELKKISRHFFYISEFQWNCFELDIDQFTLKEISNVNMKTYTDTKTFQNLMKVSKNKMKGLKLTRKQRFLEKCIEGKLKPFCRIKEIV